MKSSAKLLTSFIHHIYSVHLSLFTAAESSDLSPLENSSLESISPYTATRGFTAANARGEIWVEPPEDYSSISPFTSSHE